MKIAFIDDNPFMGGGPLAMATMMSNIEGEKFLLRCCEEKEIHSRCKDFTYCKIPDISYPINLSKTLVFLRFSPCLIIYVFRIFIILLKIKPDIVWVNNYMALIPIGLIRFVMRYKVVFCAHSADLPTDRKAKYMYSFSNSIVCVSKTVKEHLSSLDLKRSVHVVYNVSYGTGPATPARRYDGIALGYVGRLSKEKGVSDLILTLRHLPENFQLILVGDGPEVSNLISLATQFGLQDRVVFLGHQDLTLSHYLSFCVFCLASPREGSSLAIIEALNAGTQVVAYPAKAIVEIFGDLKSVTISDDFTPESLADKIKSLNCKRQFSENEVEIIKNRFSNETQRTALQKVITELLNKDRT